MNINNVGRFCVSMKIMEKHTDQLARFLAEINFVPVRAEILDFGREIEYIGLSDRFREVKQGESYPYYRIEEEYYGRRCA